MSLNILSSQQQTFESDLNNMMIDIQLISNSVSTLTGGGGNEYYITDSATNTDKLSFCYNLKDNIENFNFTDQFNNINMNGGTFSKNTLSGSTKMFNLNGAEFISSNSFSSFTGKVNLTCSKLCNNSFTRIDEFNVNAIYASKNSIERQREFGHIITVESDSFISNSMIDLTGFSLASVSFYSNGFLNFNYNYINKLFCSEADILNISGEYFSNNNIARIFSGNFIGQWQNNNKFSSVKFNNIKAYTIDKNNFSMNTNLNLSAEGIINNTFSIVNTLNFSCNQFNNNSFPSTVNKLILGNFESMYANNISDVSKISLNGNIISDNIFHNCTICNIDALTFSVNNFNANTVKLLNMTGELIDSNTFGYPRIANIIAITFNNNTMDVADYLDLKADTIASNSIFAVKLNGMFEGQFNSIFANYATLCGTLASNDLKLINGRIHGGLIDNTIHGTSFEIDTLSQTIGRLTINNFTDYGGNTNYVSMFDVVHVDGERGPMLFAEINKIYLDSLNSGDSFSNVKSIYYSDSSLINSNHYTNFGTQYHWQKSTQPSWSPSI